MLRRKMMLGVSVVALAAAAGCSVGPDYSVPVPAMPGAYAGATRPSSRPADAGAESAWREEVTAYWKLFSDPTLDELVGQALEGSLDVRLARERLAEARALRAQAGAGGLPTVDGVGSASRSERSANTGQPGPRTSNSFSAGFDAAWELDVFGGVRRSVEAAEADLESAIEDERGTRVSLVAEVARNYIELRGYQRQIAIAKKNAATQRETLKLIQSRLDAGVDSDLNVARAEAQLATTAATVPAFEQLERRAALRIGVLLGRQSSELLGRLAGEGTRIPSVEGAVDAGVPAQLLWRRPDVRRAERELAAATARVGVATAELYPRFTFGGTLGLNSNATGTFFKGSSDYWSFGPGVRVPLLEWGRIRAAIAASDARAKQAMTRYEQQVLVAVEEVENAVVAYDKERQRLAVLQQAVAASQRAVDITAEKYRTGPFSFLDVLEAQRTLFAAEDQMVQSQRAVSANLVQLYKALGGGWKPEK